MAPPDKLFTFKLVFEAGAAKEVKVADWKQAGAWGTLCRDLAKDHGNTNMLQRVELVKVEALKPAQSTPKH